MACLSPRELDLLAAAGPSDEQTAGLAAHLAQCTICRENLEDVAANRALEDELAAAFAGRPHRVPVSGAEPGTGNGEGSTVSIGVGSAHEGSGLFNPDDVIPGYRLHAEIHRGGQGVVYQATQLATKRIVAIKVLLEGTWRSDRARRRFEREVELAAMLDHPHIVTIHDSGIASGRYYFAMAHVAGLRLDQHVREKELSIRQILELFVTICDAINYAHQRGVIHRDLKPGNILVDASGKPCILDFGLAKHADRVESIEVSIEGQVLGTIAYMAPEQASGRLADIDIRTDVYALGVILYELLVGRPPYELKGSLHGMLQTIQQTPPAAPRAMHRGLDDELETILLRALAKERPRRYQSVAALGEDLSHYLRGEAIDAKRDSRMYVLRKTVRRYRIPLGLICAFVLLLAGSAVGLGLMWRRSERDRIAAERSRAETVIANTQLRRSIYSNYLTLARQAQEDESYRYMRELLRACPVELRGWEWRHLWSRADRSIQTFGGDGLIRTSVQFSADGQRLLVMAGDGTASVLEAATGGVQVRMVQGSYGTCATWSPDARWIAAAMDSKTGALASSPIRIYDAASGAEKKRLGGRYGVRSLQFSTDGRWLAGAGSDGVARLWSCESGREETSFSLHHGAIYQLSFSPDASTLLTAGADGRVLVTRVRDGDSHVLLEGEERALCAAISPDGQWWAAGTEQGKLHVWHARDGREVTQFADRHVSGRCTAVAFARQGEWIAAAEQGGTLRVYRTADADLVTVLWGHDLDVFAIAAAPAGRRLASVGDDGMIKTWDLSAEPPADRLVAHRGAVNALAWDGASRFWSAGADGVLSAWSDESLQPHPAGSPPGDADPITSLSIRNGTLAYSTGRRVHIRGPGRPEFTFESPELSIIADVALLRGLDVVLVAGTGRTRGSDPPPGLQWRSTATGALLREPEDHTGQVTCLALGSDEQLLATGGTDGLIRFYDARTGAYVRSAATRQGALRSLAWSPAGNMMASAGSGGVVRLWRTPELTPLASLEGHTEDVTSLAFTPDSLRLITAGMDQTIRFWDVNAVPPREVCRWRGHEAGVTALAMSADNRTLLSGAGDGSLRIWSSARDRIPDADPVSDRARMSE